jgi:fatty-acyl-CoA synthase
MTVTLDAVEGDPRQIADLRRELAPRTAERDEALAQEAAAAEVLGVVNSSPGGLAMTHLAGYVEIKDRSKDIIISSGEHLSTSEVENVLCRHPAVLEAAVAALPDPQRGEIPCAIVALQDGVTADPAETIAFRRARCARFKAPRHIISGPLPKTSTRKIQRLALQARERSELNPPL